MRAWDNKVHILAFIWWAACKSSFEDDEMMIWQHKRTLYFHNLSLAT